MKVNRPAADLRRGTITSQPFCCSTRAVAQLVWRNITSPTQPVNSATRARRWPIAGKNFGQAAAVASSGGSMSTSCRSRGGNSCNRPRRLGQRDQAQRCAIRAGANSRPHAELDTETAGTGSSGETSRRFLPVVAGLLHRHAKRLDQLAVLHARGAGRLAGPAVEAQLQVPPHFVRQSSRPSVTPASDRCVRAGCRSRCRSRHRWAGRRAQPAMDAVEKQLIVDRRAGGCASFVSGCGSCVCGS